jgi:hypothetical protein
MNPQYETVAILIVFIIILLITHGIAVFCGWKMGLKTNRPIEQIMSVPTKKKKSKPYHDESDIFNESTLDFK